MATVLSSQKASHIIEAPKAIQGASITNVKSTEENQSVEFILLESKRLIKSVDLFLLISS